MTGAGEEGAYDQEVPCSDVSLSCFNEFWTRAVYLQVRMFFSSGAAHTKGGGSLCITTYSFVNCASAFVST